MTRCHTRAYRIALQNRDLSHLDAGHIGNSIERTRRQQPDDDLGLVGTRALSNALTVERNGHRESNKP